MRIWGARIPLCGFQSHGLDSHPPSPLALTSSSREGLSLLFSLCPNTQHEVGHMVAPIQCHPRGLVMNVKYPHSTDKETEAQEIKWLV